MNAALDAILKTRLLGIIRMNRYEYPAEVARAVAVAIGGNLVSSVDIANQQFAETTRRASIDVQVVSSGHD